MEITEITQPSRNWRKYKKPALITIGVILVLTALIAVSTFTYAKAYDGRILPNVYIGVVNVGELKQADATEVLQQHIDDLLNQGVDVRAVDYNEDLDPRMSTEDLQQNIDDLMNQGVVNIHSGHLDLRASAIDEPDLAHDILYFDTADLVEVAMSVGRSDSFWRNLWTPVSLLIEPEVLDVNPQIDENDIREQLAEQFSELETPSLPADYSVNLSNEDEPVQFMPGKNGIEINYDYAVADIWDDANDLDLETLSIILSEVTYDMTEEDALSISDNVISVVEAAPYYLTYTSETLYEYLWTIDEDDVADWIEPYYFHHTDSGEPEVELHFAGDAYEEFIENITDDINIDPVNARFVMEDNIVTEFSGSRDGIEFDSDATMLELLGELGSEDVTIEITVASTAPIIPTSEVNSLGISQIIGIGTSDFSGSPSNRIKNIQHGASKLNGLLIAPGETISLVEELGPFTEADGYLAELVIKGDEIKPEVGGGLCQIGTTTFRAAMNAGLQIDERRNHSLVVSYYNDPSNGNPGTDATIYDPYPDFKFTNNFDTHILLITNVNTANYQITFTFWGTSDGRDAYYSAPVVLSWTGYGDPEYTQTTDLEPGTESCQSPHPGATAEFTYFVNYADGTEFSETYTSDYRPLPMICLVGVEEIVEECVEGEECEDTEEVDATEEIEGTEETEDTDTFDDPVEPEAETTGD